MLDGFGRKKGTGAFNVFRGPQTIFKHVQNWTRRRKWGPEGVAEGSHLDFKSHIGRSGKRSRRANI